MKTLAIDYGTKRVGTAISYASLAQPWKIIENNPHLITQLQQIIAEQNIKQIVVGVSENVMAEKTREFVQQLKAAVTLPIQLEDETLTSYQVHEFLKSHPAKKRQGPIDHLAAAVILERFLTR